MDVLTTSDYPVPNAGWVQRAPHGADDYIDEDLTAREYRRFSTMQRRRDLQGVLGTLSVNTTILARPGGGVIGPARDREGRVLRWSLWAPQRGVLIDDFTRVPPSQAERDDRTAFAGTHGLQYAVVERGSLLTAKAVKEWLDG